jgi:hypothetical protein
MKRRRAHLQIIDAPLGYRPACAPWLLVKLPTRGLVFEPQLVTCGACRTLMLAAMREKAREAR